ncbi:MAG: ferredoxin--NADP reductase [Saprospiraceae bacterium]
MAKKWFDSKVIKIEDESSTTKRFWVQVEGDEIVDFKAGQFVTLDLPISDKRTKRWRSYSIANAPDQSNILEFCIVLLEGGAGTTYFFEEVKIGTEIKFKKPAGGFYLPEKIETDLVFICTGTGVAPFRSMLWDIYNNKIPHKNIHLIFGTRTEDGILYEKEFEDLIEKMPELKYSVALSRAENLPQKKYELAKGYVHPIYQKHFSKVRNDVDFWICGWSNMIDEAVAKLMIEMNYDKGQIHYELYG